MSPNFIPNQQLTLTGGTPFALNAHQIIGNATYVVSNGSANTLYWGTTASLSSSNGIPIPAGVVVAITLDFQTPGTGTGIWLLAGTTTSDVTVTAFS